jgi:iron complex transport system substrate-binding protein
VIGAMAAAAVSVACASTHAASIPHAMGEARVARRPSRIVVLTNEGTEALIALGVRPVGAVRSWSPEATWYPHLGRRMAGVVVVGDEDHVDVPLVARLRPQLILGNKLRQEARFAELAEIAPTVFSETLRGDWKRNLLLYGAAARREARAADLLVDWNRRVLAARTALRDVARTRVAVVRFMPDRTRIYYERSFSGVVLRDVGFARAHYARSDDSFEDLPRERIQGLAADAIFYFTYEDGSGAAADRERSWTADPSWVALPAVRSGRAFRVDDGTWNTSGGILAARLMLEDVVRHLGPPGARPASRSRGDR